MHQLFFINAQSLSSQTTWWKKKISSSSFPFESGTGLQEIVKQEILSNSQLYSDIMLFLKMCQVLNLRIFSN